MPYHFQAGPFLEFTNLYTPGKNYDKVEPVTKKKDLSEGIGALFIAACINIVPRSKNSRGTFRPVTEVERKLLIWLHMARSNLGGWEQIASSSTPPLFNFTNGSQHFYECQRTNLFTG